MIISKAHIQLPEGNTRVEGEVSATHILGLHNSNILISGSVEVEELIKVESIEVSGCLHCKELRAEGILRAKKGSVISADMIFYRNLEIEPGAVILGKMSHLDTEQESNNVDPSFLIQPD